MPQNAKSKTRFIPRRWLGWGILLGLLYGSYVVVMYVSQRHIMFPGRHRSANEPLADHTGREIFWLERDGAKVEVWYLPPLMPNKIVNPPAAIHPVSATSPEKKQVVPSASAPLVIYFHGNGELIDDWPTLLQTYRSWGCGVALVEYPDYGRSSGEPCEATISANAVAAYDQLIKRPDVDPTRVVAHGRSMGGGAACALARERPLAALILESTYTSLIDMAGRYWLPGALCSERFDNLATVSTWQKPLLILHGKLDWTVPHEHGAALAAANSAATFISWTDRGHNDHPPNVMAAWGDIETFLQKAGVLNSQPGK
ncbi:MAG: alpha/beta hydrolase [Pirellulales bacterium]|nr:alpha/beta hydrolase [Pirellulales bacterium]